MNLSGLGAMVLEAVQGGGTPVDLPEEERNHKPWSPPTAPSPVVDAPLAYPSGGNDQETDALTRLVTLPGPQATLRGVARTVAWYSRVASGAGQWLDDDTIARALLVYNREYLGVRKLGTWMMGEWKVGMRLTLPIEVEFGADQMPKRIVVERAKLATWGAAATWDSAWTPLLELPATPLGLPVGDPRPGVDTIEVVVKKRLDAPWDAAAFGDGLRKALLTNPYDVMFELIETMRQIRLDHPERALPLVLRVADGIARRQAAQLGWTTAGSAALRAFWRVLAAADPNALPQADRVRLARAKEMYAAALGLVPNGDGDWHGPLDRGPTVVPVEPPLTKRQRDVTAVAYAAGTVEPYRAEPPDEKVRQARLLGRHEMVLGRNVGVGEIGAYNRWRGPSHTGDRSPKEFFDAHPESIGPNPTPLRQAAVRLAFEIAGTEGRLDACRAQDRALLSTGFQQWSVHVNTEMSVLLHRFRRRAPEHYDLLFGLYGLQTAKWAAARGKNAKGEAENPTEAEIAADNKYDAPGRSPYGDDFPSYVTFRQILPGEKEKPLPPDPDAKPGVRFAFFGATQANTGVRELSSAWCGRIRIAALASTDYCVEQVQTAVFRLQRVLDAQPPARAPFPGRPDVRQLFSSTFGAGLLLDFHVNQPGDQPAVVARAIDRTLKAAPNPFVDGDPKRLDPVWERRLAINHMAARLVNDVMSGRNAHLVRRHDQGLDPTPGSFTGWVPPQ